jgi:hypothetical protein
MKSITLTLKEFFLFKEQASQSIMFQYSLSGDHIIVEADRAALDTLGY